MTDSPALLITLQDWLPWLFITALGAWGGLVIYFRRLRHQKERSSPILELIGDLTTSGFVAVLIGIIMRSYYIPWAWCFFCAGVGGHLGARTLFITEWLGLRRLWQWLGLPPEEVETLLERPTGFPRAGKRLSEPASKPQSGSGSGPGPGAGG